MSVQSIKFYVSDFMEFTHDDIGSIINTVSNIFHEAEMHGYRINSQYRDAKKVIISCTFVRPQDLSKGNQVIKTKVIPELQKVYSVGLETSQQELIYRDSRYRLAAKVTMWHGTASGTGDEMFRRIMKQGLNPNPKHRVFNIDTDQDPEWQKRDIETYGGVYFASDAFSALTFANGARRKFGGDALLIAAQLETRTPTARIDEDALLSGDEFWLQSYLAEVKHVAINSYYVLELLLDPAGVDWDAVADHFIARKITSRWTVPAGRISTIKPLVVIAMELQARYWLAKMADIGNLSYSSQYRFDHEYQGEKNPEVLRKQNRAAAEKVLQKLREATTPRTDTSSNRIRILEPVGFSGQNRILAILRVVDIDRHGTLNSPRIDNPYHTTVTVLYNRGAEAVDACLQELKQREGPYMLWKDNSTVIYDKRDPNYVEQKVAAKMIRFQKFRGAVYRLADFADLYPHDKWVDLTNYDLNKHPELVNEIKDLIENSYRDIGGHVTLKSKQDLLRGDLVFHAIDLDQDPYADAVRVEERTPFGYKGISSGQDGGVDAKVRLMLNAIATLKRGGHYAEVSGALAHILLKHNVPIVDSEKQVREILRGKTIEWLGAHPEGKAGNGWYERAIGGKTMIKIMVGKPLI